MYYVILTFEPLWIHFIKLFVFLSCGSHKQQEQEKKVEGH